jgi:hypothetical protein
MTGQLGLETQRDLETHSTIGKQHRCETGFGEELELKNSVEKGHLLERPASKNYGSTGHLWKSSF